MKPHKWGYKLFVMTGVSGFAYNLGIYSDQKNYPALRLSSESDISARGNVVVRLPRIVPLDKHFKLYYNNYEASEVDDLKHF